MSEDKTEYQKKENPDQRPFTEEEKKAMQKQVGWTREQKIEMMQFCSLDLFDDNTLFIDIKYKGAREGRTCVILGTFGFNARVSGNQKGAVYNQNLGLSEEKETNFDLCFSYKRTEIVGVCTKRIEPDYSNSGLDEVDLMLKPKYVYDLIITTSFNHTVTLYGLLEADAIVFKKMLWGWMNFHAMPNNVQVN